MCGGDPALCVMGWAEAAGIDTQAMKLYYEITDMADLKKLEVQIYQEIAEYCGDMNLRKQKNDAIFKITSLHLVAEAGFEPATSGL